MTEHAAAVAKLRELAGRIDDDTDRVLYEEAVICFAGGAFRAGYIVAWIAAAESFRTKFWRLAQRDVGVGKILAAIDAEEKNNRAPDATILRSARTLQMIADDDFKKLEHVRDMRNTYAHPTSAGPGPEELFAVLLLVAEVVLCRPPLLRHGYARELVEVLFTDQHFLQPDAERVRDYARTMALRFHPETHPFLFGLVMDRLEPIVDDPQLAVYRDRGLAFAEGLLDAVAPDLSASVWDVVERIRRVPNACALVLGDPRWWTRLPEQAQHMVVGHLLEPIAPRRPEGLRLRRASVLAESGLLDEVQRARFDSAVGRADYETLLQHAITFSAFAGKVIADLRSHEWPIQNPAAKVLWSLKPAVLGQAPAETQEQIGRNVVQAADGGSHGARRLIEALRSSPVPWPQVVVEGMLLECLVDDDGLFRFKDGCYADVVAIVAGHPDAAAILGRSVAAVSASTPKNPWGGSRPYDEAEAPLVAALAAHSGAAATGLAGLAHSVSDARSRAAVVAAG